MKLHLPWAQGTCNLFLLESWKFPPWESCSPNHSRLWLGRNFRTLNQDFGVKEAGSPGLWDLYERLSGESRTVFPLEKYGAPNHSGLGTRNLFPCVVRPNTEAAAAASVRSGKKLSQAVGLQNTRLPACSLGSQLPASLEAYSPSRPRLLPGARWVQCLSSGLGLSVSRQRPPDSSILEPASSRTHFRPVPRGYCPLQKLGTGRLVTGSGEGYQKEGGWVPLSPLLLKPPPTCKHGWRGVWLTISIPIGSTQEWTREDLEPFLPSPSTETLGCFLGLGLIPWAWAGEVPVQPAEGTACGLTWSKG